MSCDVNASSGVKYKVEANEFKMSSFRFADTVNTPMSLVRKTIFKISIQLDTPSKTIGLIHQYLKLGYNRTKKNQVSKVFVFFCV